MKGQALIWISLNLASGSELKVVIVANVPKLTIIVDMMQMTHAMNLWYWRGAVEC